MKNDVTLLLLALILTGCATTQAPPAAPAPSSAQQIRGLYDSFARGDVPAVLGSFDPNIVWWEAENINFADHNPYRGPQAVLEGVFMRLPQEWNNYKINVEEMIDGGDTVAVLGRYAGTHTKTGQPLNAQFVHVWKLRNGKIVKFQQYADTAQFARVTGAWR